MNCGISSHAWMARPLEVASTTKWHIQLPLVTILIWHHRHAIISRDNLSKVRTLNRYSLQRSDKPPQHFTRSWQGMTSWQDIWENTYGWDKRKAYVNVLHATVQWHEWRSSHLEKHSILRTTDDNFFTISSNLEVVGVWVIINLTIWFEWMYSCVYSDMYTSKTQILHTSVTQMLCTSLYLLAYT